MKYVANYLRVLLVAATLCLATENVLAQQPQGPIGSPATNTTTTEPAPPPSGVGAVVQGAATALEKAAQTGIPASTVDSMEAEMAKLKSDFGLLKILGLISIAVAAAIGLTWYAIRHKKLQSFDTGGGVLLTVVSAPILFSIATAILPADSSACLSLALGSGADSSAFFDTCRSAREAAANMTGFKSLWAIVFGQSIINGVVVPLPAAVVKSLMYASVCIGAPVLFFALKPLVKAALYKR